MDLLLARDIVISKVSVVPSDFRDSTIPVQAPVMVSGEDELEFEESQADRNRRHAERERNENRLNMECFGYLGKKGIRVE